jgi:hypothetical protein
MVTQPPTVLDAEIVGSTASASSAPVLHSAGTKMRIPGNRVMDAIKDLPPEEHDAIWWFYNYIKKYDLAGTELGSLLRKPGGTDFYSADSIGQLISGGRIRRGENIAPMIEAILAFKKVEEVREQQVNSGFIETRLFQEIEKRCLRALHRQRIMYIFGDGQIGKSACLREVQRRHNHGQTIYVEVPSGGAIGTFLRELARIMKVPARTTITQLRGTLIDMFNSRMMLIVDEGHRCTNAKAARGGSQVFDFLREVINKAQCGIVIAMTNEGRDELLHGRHAKAYEQIWRRRIAPLQLPSVAFEDDLARFANAYGLPPAPDETITVNVTVEGADGVPRKKPYPANPLRIQRIVNEREGLGVWISILQDASDMAREAKKSITWGAVIKAYALAQADAEVLR